MEWGFAYWKFEGIKFSKACRLVAFKMKKCRLIIDQTNRLFNCKLAVIQIQAVTTVSKQDMCCIISEHGNTKHFYNSLKIIVYFSGTLLLML